VTTPTCVALFERFDAIHDRHNLGDRAESDPAMREVLRVTHDALAALAKAEGVNPFTLSCTPALVASIGPKPAPISPPAA
jgi:hypothetical protein